jgi:thioredoxin-like negative regulator of GroEL
MSDETKSETVPAPTWSEKDWATLATQPLSVIVRFGAGWCAPCRVMGPELDRASQSLKGVCLVGKVDIQASPRLAERYAVSGIPQVVVIRNGFLVERCPAGGMTAAQLEELGRKWA